jgi:hypothetical protein
VYVDGQDTKQDLNEFKTSVDVRLERMEGKLDRALEKK